MTEAIEFGPAKRARVEWDSGRGCVHCRTVEGMSYPFHFTGGPVPSAWPPESHAPARELWERCRPLAEDEVILTKGKRRKMRVVQEPIATLEVDHGQGGVGRYSREEMAGMAKARPNPVGWPRALAYFDRHAPKPGPINDGAGWRFENGEEIEFWMQDSGEARGGLLSTTPLGAPCIDVTRALYAFRDRERAKWTFERLLSHVQVRQCGRSRGYHDKHGWSGLVPPTVPTWVREKARKMWEEMQEAPKTRAYYDRKVGGCRYMFKRENGELWFQTPLDTLWFGVSELPPSDPIRLAAEEWHREQTLPNVGLPPVPPFEFRWSVVDTRHVGRGEYELTVAPLARDGFDHSARRVVYREDLVEA